MTSDNIHNYVVGFVPMLIAAVVFQTTINANTERMAKAVETLAEVVEDNTKRGIANSQNIAVLDNRVGYLEKGKE